MTHCLLLSFFTLLDWKPEKKVEDDLDEQEKEKMKKQKGDRTWANWLSSFLVYCVF